MKKEHVIEALIITAILTIMILGLATHNHKPKSKHEKANPTAVHR